MISRLFPPAFAAALLCSTVATARPPEATATTTAAPTPGPMPSIVYRSDETDATAQGLASQPQFSGTGIVALTNESGTGAIIAPQWVLTAKHVVTADGTITTPAGNSVTFYYAGGNRVSDAVYLDSLSDMALVHFAAALPSNLAIITPNLNGTTKVQPVGAQVWNVGYGSYGTYPGTTVNSPNGARRGGTNIVDSYSSPYLIFDNDNTSGTEFECSTGPGDSGGPMFLQNGYQWRIAAIVYGADSRGFIDTDVTHENFLSNITGIAFAPAAAPTALKWNSVYLNPTSNSSKIVTALTDGGGNWNTTRLNFTDGNFTYAWENGTITGQVLLPVTFGVGSGSAGTVTVTTPINISNLTFAVTGGGAYTIAGSGTNGLTLLAAGSAVTVNAGAAAPLISAPLFGSGALTKLGAGGLVLGGTNTYTGGTNVNAGGLQISAQGALGTSGNIAVASGATLSLDPLGSGTGYALAAGRTLTDNGTITGSLSVGGTLTGAGAVGTTASNNTLTVSAGGLVSGATGTLTIRNAITNNGTISMPDGAVLDASATPSFANNGVLSLTNGNAKLPGNFANGSNGVLTDAGGTLTLSSSGLVNNGTIRLTGGAVLDASAASYIQNYGVIDLLDGSLKVPPGGVMNINGGTVLTPDLLRIKSTTRTGTSVILTVDSYTGHKYQLQRGATPDAASFANLGSAQAGSTGTTLTFTDANPPAGQGFYRVVLVP